MNQGMLCALQVSLLYSLAVSTGIMAPVATAATPGSYIGEFCWRVSFNRGGFESYYFDGKEWLRGDNEFVDFLNTPTLLMKLHATDAGGKAYNLRGHIVDSFQPSKLGSLALKVQQAGQYLYWVVQHIDGITIDRESGELSLWPIGPRYSSWKTDSTLEGDIALRVLDGSSYYYQHATGLVRGKDLSTPLPEGWLSLDLIYGSFKRVPCDQFPH